MRTQIRTFVWVVLAIATCEQMMADWPRFRGANGAGLSQEIFPATWEDKDYAWTADLPGTGTSSPVIWGDRLFITAAAMASRGQLEADQANDGRKLQCYRIATGELLWQQSFDIEVMNMHKDATYANGTPAVDQDHVYVLWQDKKDATVHAFTHDGKKVWTASLGGFRAQLGAAGSPIVHKDKLIVIHDQNTEDTFRVALNTKRGTIAWKEAHTGEKIRDCYATPVIYTSKNGKAIGVSVHSYRGFAGFDIETGKTIWELRNCFGDHNQRAIASPIICDDLVISASGFAKGKRNLVAVDAQTGKEVWRLRDRVPYLPTPVAKGKWLFLWEDSGVVRCVLAATGKILWEEKLRGSYFSSPLIAGDKLYGIDRQGQVHVIAASDKYKYLGSADLKEQILSSPAASQGYLIFRTDRRLLALSAN